MDAVERSHTKVRLYERIAGSSSGSSSASSLLFMHVKIPSRLPRVGAALCQKCTSANSLGLDRPTVDSWRRSEDGASSDGASQWEQCEQRV